jgi:catechol 2,3-dioxygenase-like lactoylglutathione lyase family enzyme
MLVSRFDHAVIAVRDLNAAIDDYRALGFDCRLGGRHKGRGTHNAVIRFGLDYLELIAVEDERLARSCGGNVLELVEYLDSVAAGPLGFALAAPDLDALASHWPSDLPSPLGPIPMERVRPDGSWLTWRLLIPGGSAWRRPWPFFIEWETPDNERLDQDGRFIHSNGASGVLGVSLVVRSGSASAPLFVRALGLTAEGPSIADEERGALRTQLRLGDFRVDLLEPNAPGPAMTALEGSGEGLFQIDLAVPDLGVAASRTGAEFYDDDSVLIPSALASGTRIRLVASN